ncbi:nitroreductase family protein [Anaerocolumna sp. MB42-C2]|uniref:nitroreductase family protein n=1 Tax=Anaerocolumna sp. MB42-C2 TaxID=3070997 RepID=UPI0027E008E8|nr:nitroreductase family protein [Anaerocolumna sp. MB42-C2]WMJ87221.1 nitroreductase family protein [Anaerocolumna sp. MB42-C2]
MIIVCEKGVVISMDFTKVVLSRRAIRNYKTDPVPEEILQRLYEAMNAAPSGNNHQPYRFIFVRKDDIRKELALRACHQDFLLNAPILVAACCEKDRAFDTAIAMEHLILSATNEGLGSCLIGWFEREIVREILNIPHNHEIPILASIGYAAESPEAKPRKPLNELISYDRF